MKTFADMTSQERKEFAEEQPKRLTKLIRDEGLRQTLLFRSKPQKDLTKDDIKTLLKECCDDSDDDNAFSNESENEYADEESNKKEWDMTYEDSIFFILGYIQKNKIEFGNKQQQFIQFCYFKMIKCDECGDCSDCDKPLNQYPVNFNVDDVDKRDLEHYCRLYKDIQDKWEQFLNHIHHTDISIAPNFNYTDCFYNDKFGLVEKQT